MTTTTTDTPRAWVGCLACYNEGRHSGGWVEAIEAEDYVPCTRPGHEEWWCFDHEGFGGLIVGECAPAEAQRKAELLAEVEAAGYPAAAFAAYAENVGAKYADLDGFTDSYRGAYESGKDFAEEFTNETDPHIEGCSVASYVDWEAVWRGSFDCDGWWFTRLPDGSGAVFGP